ncbi:MAG: Import inner membrane translocase subunit Tim44, partial [Halothiobacillaceae bacterium]
NGAKACFNRLQAAWDQGDLAEIRQFTTDHVFAEIQDQFRARGGETQTEVLSLNAQLLRVEDIGSKMEAVVLFEAEMREDGAPAQVAEIWHFTRPTASTQPTWFVDGIQQVEG